MADAPVRTEPKHFDKLSANGVGPAPAARSMSTTRVEARFALALMVASGFAALGLQIVWTQQSALWLGQESAALLAVVGAFFGGLALGAWSFAARIERSARPARWYAVCEAVIGLWALLLTALLPLVTPGLLALTGVQPGALRQWAVAFAGTFVLLLPATVAMGATLPAMERVLARAVGRGVALAALYAGNTAGGVLGVLAAAFWLVPSFGLARTAGVCALLNLACAAVAWRWGGDNTALREPTVQPPRAASPSLLWLLAATGCLGIGYEVLVVRVLSQVTENTVYTFAMLLATYLVGTALGAAAWQRWGAGRSAQGARERLLQALAGACLLGLGALALAPQIKALALHLLGASLAGALAAEAALAALAFLPATVVMGALFSQLSKSVLAQGTGFGRALAVNTLGAALAPPLFGVVLLPALGAKAALLGVVAGYLLLSLSRASPMRVTTAGLAAALALAAFALPPLTLIEIPDGGRLVRYIEGPAAAVSVVEDGEGVSRLHINNRQQEGSSHSLVADARQALLPLLLHTAPRRALFLGLGTGVTASSAAEDAQLQVEAVELLPEVIDASAHFTSAFTRDGTATRLRTVAADARRHVRMSSQRYDLVVADNFHPARSGSGALYTVEHFRAVGERLAEGGLFCQWLPLHQLDLPTLRSIVRAFVEVHPQAWAVLATNSLETPVLGLVARRGGERFDPAAVAQRMHTVALPQPPSRFGLHDEWALLGSFVAGPRALAHFAGDAPVNTDDHPVVSYRAPRVTYAPDSRPAERLIELLQAFALTPDEVLPSDASAAMRARLAAYWRARDRFLDIGRRVQPTSDARRMLTQVREPLLEVLRLSPDFRPAYDPLVRLAAALAASDPAAARALLAALIELQPARPEAADTLRALAATVP
jgi:spermidine synthase